MPARKPIPVGAVFSRLTIVGHAPPKIRANIRYHQVLCRCSCGTLKVLGEAYLRAGVIQSCGCFNRELMQIRRFKHGHAKNKSQTYRSWDSMIQRCTNPKHDKFGYYGGRGIIVCERWKVFLNFLEDMGERPDGLTLERKDNEKGYSSENCYWASRKHQQRNRRANIIVSFRGITGCVTAVCEHFGFSPKRVLDRLKRGGWIVEDAFALPRHAKHARKKRT